MKYKNVVKCLAIEITRRCNQQCLHCSKGEPQELDISKEVIDKALEEVSDAYIDSLRISGGEPMLVPELIEYLCNKIIEQNMSINNVIIFTNGTIKSEVIKSSLERLLDYLNSISSSLKKIADEIEETKHYMYNGTEKKKISLIVSETFHDNKECVDDTINFYQINDDNFSIVKESTSFKSQGERYALTIEGRTLLNYDKLLGTVVKANDVRVIHNKYFLFSTYVNNSKCRYWSKAISVSANGNIYVGCSSSYERIDTNPLFNITECNYDFFDKMEEWCWQHPVNEKVNQFRERYDGVCFCKERGIKIAYLDKDSWIKTRFAYEASYAYERIAKDMHVMCPSLCFFEIDAMATATVCLELLNANVPKQYIKSYLEYCSDFSADDIAKAMNPEWLRGFILFITEKDAERRKMNRQQRRKNNFYN